ncbi:MAG: antiviral reverse transcriptase Drt3b [Alcanivorax sp.]
MKKRIKIDKKDYMRAVLTDTSPSDVPIIFSNDGFYINHHRVMSQSRSGFDILRSFYFKILSPSGDTEVNSSEGTQKQNQQSAPMKYKIIKSESSLRTLSLIHPRSQKNYCSLYKDFSDAFIYLCSGSGYSIRSPSKVGSSFYDTDYDTVNKYKEVNIETIEDDLRKKHASSFFVYHGYDRLYKFFSSSRFFDLEKKFSKMQFSDVANCFDTIYTHTVSWAIKDKEYIKRHVRFHNQFCQKLDSVMQRSNSNETNGIPVGAEFSRLFSEIIFQDIDCKVDRGLSGKFGWRRGYDYEIVRYVDDYIFFYNDEESGSRIKEEIEDCLALYNLYLNESKIETHDRPFFTHKSKVVSGVNNAVAELEASLVEVESVDGYRRMSPKKVNNIGNLERSFISKIKIVTGSHNSGYYDVSPYIVGVLSKRILRFIESYRAYRESERADSNLTLKVRDVILTLTRIIFFFYTVCPSVSASESLARVIVTIDRFFKKNMPYSLAIYRSTVMESVEKIDFHKQANDYRMGYVSLERLNIIIATSCFGAAYRLPGERLVFGRDETWLKNISYFDIVCLLFYFRDYEEYEVERNQVVNAALSRIYSRGFNLLGDAESAYLFLDLMSCPFVGREVRSELFYKYLDIYEPNLNRDSVDLDQTLERLLQVYWFVKWLDVDLIKSLQRKRLKRSY